MTGTESDTIPPDPEGKAEGLLEAPPTARRGRGRPKGGGKAKSQATAEESAPADLGPPTEAEIASMSVLLGVLWGLLAVRAGGLTDLDDAERRQLGTAAVPVFRKYANMLGGFEAEFGFVIVVGGLVMTHTPPSKPKSSAFEVDEEIRR